MRRLPRTLPAQWLAATAGCRSSLAQRAVAWLMAGLRCRLRVRVPTFGIACLTICSACRLRHLCCNVNALALVSEHATTHYRFERLHFFERLFKRMCSVISGMVRGWPNNYTKHLSTRCMAQQYDWCLIVHAKTVAPQPENAVQEKSCHGTCPRQRAIRTRRPRSSDTRRAESCHLVVQR